MSNFGLSDLDIQELTHILKKYPEVEQAIIFGSRAMGNYRQGSDIDMTLKGDALTPKIESKIWNDLEDSNIPYFFDLSIYHFLTTPNFIKHIDEKGKIFYQKESS